MSLDKFSESHNCQFQLFDKECANPTTYFNEEQKKWLCDDHKSFCKYCKNWIITGTCCVSCYLTNLDAKQEKMDGWNPTTFRRKSNKES